MKIKLNGWQRLLVVLTTIWAGPVLVLQARDWPTETKIRDSWVNAYVQKVISSTPKFRDFSVEEIRATYREIASDEKLIDAIEAKYSESVNLTSIKNVYTKKMQELPRSQVFIVGQGVIYWLGPALIVAVLFMMLSWVRDGFRNSLQQDP